MLQSFGVHYDDIVQLDELIEHAQFHSEQYGDNMIVFLSKHYGELKADHQRDHQEEKKDHEKLPFNHSSTSHTCVADVFISIYKSDLNVVEFLDSIIYRIHSELRTICSFTNSDWGSARCNE